MTNRITNRMMTDLGVRRMNERLEQFERAQSDLNTGKRLRVASDDPAGMSRALGLRSQLAGNAQAKRNADDGRMWVDLADSRLSTIGDQLQRVRELLITARNSTNGPGGAQAVAAEVGEIQRAITALANSRKSGRPVFGGFVSDDAVALVSGSWMYQGDGGQVTRRIAENEVVQVNVTGDEVFGFNAGQDVFTLLDTIVSQVTAGDLAGMGSSIEGIDAALDRVLVGRGTLGTVANRIEQAQLRNQADEISLRTVLSETEDTDLAAAIIELQMQETAYQAAQGALARALQPSLAQFLR